MHPEHLHTAVSAAAAGSRVAIYGETLHRVQRLARDVEDATPGELVERVSRLNGDNRIDFHGGGRIYFRSTHPNARGARGLSLDRVFLPIGTSPDILVEIVPALVASSEGVITGY